MRLPPQVPPAAMANSPVTVAERPVAVAPAGFVTVKVAFGLVSLAAMAPKSFGVVVTRSPPAAMLVPLRATVVVSPPGVALTLKLPVRGPAAPAAKCSTYVQDWPGSSFVVEETQ